VRRAYCLTNESLTSSFFPFTIPVAWYELFSSCLLVLGKNRRFIRGTRRHSCISDPLLSLKSYKIKKREKQRRKLESKSGGRSVTRVDQSHSFLPETSGLFIPVPPLFNRVHVLYFPKPIRSPTRGPEVACLELGFLVADHPFQTFSRALQSFLLRSRLTFSSNGMTGRRSQARSSLGSFR